MNDLNNAPFRQVNFAPVDIAVDKDDNGTIRLCPKAKLQIDVPNLPAYLRRHAEKRPDKIWLSKRDQSSGNWVGISFTEAKARVDSLTQALLNLGLPDYSKMVVLSSNSIENALISLAAMQAKLVVAPVSTAYALLSTDHIKLKEVIDIIGPELIYVEDGAKYQSALSALGLGVPVIAAANAIEGQLAYSDLLQTEVSEEVETSFNSMDPDGVAKLMFTSGSTGTPKGVPQTHRALVVSAVANLLTNGEFGQEESLRRLDWAPWSHVMGATALSLGIVNGGSLHIDDGRPAPKLFEETIRNLKEVGVNCFVTLPAAYNLLVEVLERDDEFAALFFKNLESMGYGGAALPGTIVERIQKLAVRHTGYKISVTCAYGATETGPTGAFIYWPTDITGLIGLPHPGVEMKLVPYDQDRYEVRVRGEAIMTGYYKRPDLNDEVFDDEGFYMIGDTVRLADPDDILQGLSFAGRISEEFKLQSGTFVLVGSLRLVLLKAASPLLMDVVICGESQLYLGAMAWLNLGAARDMTGRKEASLAELNRDPRIREAIEKGVSRYNQENPSNSRKIGRLVLLDTPPSIDDGEMTDKGSVNQRRSQQLREEVVNSLFDEELAEGMFSFS